MALATERIKSMTDNQANETIDAFAGKKLKRYIPVLFVQDHMANHRAKANLYIRMKGLKPPLTLTLIRLIIKNLPDRLCLSL
ncbi:MAG: hypothetical protein RIF33_01095 [Cyclobacteriaceae bacterium]